MKLSISILLVLSLVVLLMPDLSSSLPAGQLRKKNARPAIAAPRTGRKLSKPANLRKQVNLRRGKQEPEAPPPPPATEEGAPVAAAAEGDAASDVPAWCDPKKEMGAWLNFVKMRKWCADHGYTNFGPYGGVPAEMDAAAASDAGDQAPVEQAAQDEESA